jgi:hypothetical protein
VIASLQHADGHRVTAGAAPALAVLALEAKSAVVVIAITQEQSIRKSVGFCERHAPAAEERDPALHSFEFGSVCGWTVRRAVAVTADQASTFDAHVSPLAATWMSRRCRP